MQPHTDRAKLLEPCYFILIVEMVEAHIKTADSSWRASRGYQICRVEDAVRSRQMRIKTEGLLELNAAS